jgi:hypothetical protein
MAVGRIDPAVDQLIEQADFSDRSIRQNSRYADFSDTPSEIDHSISHDLCRS